MKGLSSFVCSRIYSCDGKFSDSIFWNGVWSSKKIRESRLSLISFRTSLAGIYIKILTLLYKTTISLTQSKLFVC